MPWERTLIDQGKSRVLKRGQRLLLRLPSLSVAPILFAAMALTSCQSPGLTSPSSALSPTAAAASQPDTRIYSNGTILTMEGSQPQTVESLVEQSGRIIFAGPLAEAERLYPGSVRRDLGGRTMLPGFIDSHGHLYLTGFAARMANVMPSPDGPADDFDSLVSTTRAWMESADGQAFIRQFGWVIANGFDDSMLAERRSPPAEVLDRISTTLPVLAIHQSGHVGSLNHRGLELAGITRETPDRPGAVIGRGADGTPDGIIEEAALTSVIMPIMARADQTFEDRTLAVGQNMYVRSGFTTAQEGRAFPNITAALSRASASGRLSIDIIAYPDIVHNAAAMDSGYWRTDRAYIGHYRIGGVKISLDGSPQAMTAWLSHPYFHPRHGLDADYRGYPAMMDSRAFELFDLAASHGWQILCHANGDAAIDQCINGVAHARQLYPDADHRSVLIHAQTMRSDQITQAARLRILPSFFTSHTFYWGDHHRDTTLGPERAARISPTREVLNAGLTLTAHHDAPASNPNAMRVLDATVNRTTRSGSVLGPDQRLTPFEALQALTIWGAIQSFEEATKGTLTAGKLADMVILDGNPLTIAPRDLHRLRVVATIKEGRSLYCEASAAFCDQFNN